MHEPPQQGHEASPFYVSPTLPFPAAPTSDGGAAGKVMVDVDTCGGGGGGIREEVAENKSSLADIEVRVLGEDAVIKVLSRRRPEQLIKTIAVLEEMHMSILHTNITTIEQTVLYSFNVKVRAHVPTKIDRSCMDMQETNRGIELPLLPGRRRAEIHG